MKEWSKFSRRVRGLGAASALALTLHAPAAAAEQQVIEPDGIATIAGPTVVESSPLQDIIDDIVTPKEHKLGDGDSFSQLTVDEMKDSKVKGIKSASINPQMHLFIGQNPSVNPESLINNSTIKYSSDAKIKVVHKLLTSDKLPAGTPKDVVQMKESLENLNQFGENDTIEKIKKEDFRVNRQFDRMIKKAEQGQMQEWLTGFLPKAGIKVSAEAPQDKKEKDDEVIVSPTPEPTVVYPPSENPFLSQDEKKVVFPTVGLVFGAAVIGGVISYKRRRNQEKNASLIADSVEAGTLKAVSLREMPDIQARLEASSISPEDHPAVKSLYHAVESVFNNDFSLSEQRVVPSENLLSQFFVLVENAREPLPVLRMSDLEKDMQAFLSHKEKVGRHRQKSYKKLHKRIAAYLLRQNTQESN